MATKKQMRKLLDGVDVYELEAPVTLVVYTKCPMKYKLVDRETGEEYLGMTPKEDGQHWAKIE